MARDTLTSPSESIAALKALAAALITKASTGTSPKFCAMEVISTLADM
eukprot:CAMPEP_0185573548 /NCGR_PEP_ID=MMETSP0434-20130131/5222_1 /TAXON_ID=626734 ORGANISM="Favella taraikaensis, Strain Fe Narragansett Bay" /NCGR_SAMPLE_ID=MMETSP0434 /ASSEMBLY_ACC=CAM_ASM_000379 /LENGTH=47 /DNA_ID= /DNA_START= /DNA_END= /DNA_ORIENTATION=